MSKLEALRARSPASANSGCSASTRRAKRSAAQDDMTFRTFPASVTEPGLALGRSLP